jgi:hypothetical protein
VVLNIIVSIKPDGTLFPVTLIFDRRIGQNIGDWVSLKGFGVVKKDFGYFHLGKLIIIL